MRKLALAFVLLAALAGVAHAQLVLPGGSTSGGGGGSGTMGQVTISTGVPAQSTGTCNSTTSINCNITWEFLTSGNSPVSSASYALTGSTATTPDAFRVLTLVPGNTALTIVAAGTTGYANGTVWTLNNQSGGSVSLTPTTSTIDGNASVTITNGCTYAFQSDGTNYHSTQICGSGGGSGNTTISPATGNTANNVVTMSNTTTTIKDSGTALASLAPLASPTFTGTVTLPGSGTFTSSLATLAQPGLLTSSVAPTIAAGQLGIGGLFGTPATLGANGEGQVYVSTANGLVLQGQGSGQSVTLMAAGGSNNCKVSSGGGMTCTNGFTGGNGTFTMNNSGNGIGTGVNVSNSSSGASAAEQIIFANNANNFTFLYNSTANTSGNGTGSFTMNNPDTTNTGGIFLQTGGTNALTINKAQLVSLPAISSDATHTDATVCEDTTTHALFSGSGTSGVCLGTSSIRFKRDVKPLNVGLNEILALSPKKFFFKKGWGDNGAKEHYGLIAEDAIKTDGHLVGLDKGGKPNSVDLVALVPVLVRAIQEQQAEIDHLKAKLR